MKSKDKEDETNGRAGLSTVPEVVEMCAFELKLCPRQLFLFAPTPTRKGEKGSSRQTPKQETRT